MLLPIKWLRDYVEIDEDIRTITDGLTYSGSHIESIIEMDKGIKNVVVGRILEIKKHPDADKLVVCQIDVGSEVVQIVTGATNVREGQLVPVSLVGAVLAGNLKIKKSKLRGVESFGMLCSLEEFGYQENVIPKEAADGIYEIRGDYELGTPIQEVLEMEDYVLEIEITPNRQDCLSILGLARETAATFGKDVKEPVIEIKEEVEDIADYVSIDIESENVDRYYARVIKDVKIEPSPIWLQNRIMEAGMRPISNIVDITNYVMLEFGQPLHAFDLGKVSGDKIIVRQARDGEELKTLDGNDRKLDRDDLIIADENKPVAIAGVMGGFDSEITDETKLVLLESAAFDARSVRLTSKKFNLRSEASSRFEKGIDPNLAQKAGDRFCQLVEELGAGTIIKGSIDEYKEVREAKVIDIRVKRVNDLLGTDLEADKMIGYLEGLGFDVENGGEILKVTVPTYRLDIQVEVDLIEEIGRLFGFHNIKPQALKGTLSRGEKPYSRIIEDRSKEILSGLGLNEIVTYSFISPKAYDKLRVGEDDSLREYIRLLNPLGEDYSIMRTTLLSNMMDTLSRNYNRKVKSAFLYEIGTLFESEELPIVESPDENRSLALGGYGREVDFYTMKSVVDSLLSKLGIKNQEYVREEEDPVFHPGRTANIILDGQVIGKIGEVHPDTLGNYDIRDRVYLGQLDYDLVREKANLDISFKDLPKYPSVMRDLALVLDEDILVGEIEKIINKHGKGLIEKIELFDVYTGDQIPEGKKSVAYSITYRSYEKTLTDKEINEVQEKLIEDLEESFDAELRS